MFVVNCTDFVQAFFPNCFPGIIEGNVVVVFPLGREAEAAPVPMEIEEDVEVVEMETDEPTETVDESGMEVAANVEVSAEIGDSSQVEPVSKYDVIDEIVRMAQKEFAANMEVEQEAEGVQRLVVDNDLHADEADDDVPVAPEALAFVCIDVTTGVVYDLRNGCDCGADACQQGFLNDMNAWEQYAAKVNPGEYVELPQHVIAVPRISETPMMYVPTQKITWNVEDNYVDYDDNALCLCGDFFCPMKFQLNRPIKQSRLHISDPFNLTKEDEQWHKQMLREEDEMEAEKTRRYIAILEEESKQIQEEQAIPRQEDLPRPQRSIPWTLFAGIPFYMMSDEQLASSRKELNELIESAHFRANFQWMQADQFRTSEHQERGKYSLLNVFSSIAERTENKIRHYEYLQAIVTRVMESRR